MTFTFLNFSLNILVIFAITAWIRYVLFFDFAKSWAKNLTLISWNLKQKFFYKNSQNAKNYKNSLNLGFLTSAKTSLYRL